MAGARRFRGWHSKGIVEGVLSAITISTSVSKVAGLGGTEAEACGCGGDLGVSILLQGCRPVIDANSFLLTDRAAAPGGCVPCRETHQ